MQVFNIGSSTVDTLALQDCLASCGSIYLQPTINRTARAMINDGYSVSAAYAKAYNDMTFYE